MFETYQKEIQQLRFLIETLKNKVNEKVLFIEEIQEENKKLNTEIKEQELIINDLKTKYKNLLVAKELTPNKEGKAATEKKINTIVREIDKCLALLND
jgi:chromosome segregation ATPase